jgi:threonine/homoserine/homoserine lactone efflux protein
VTETLLPLLGLALVHLLAVASPGPSTVLIIQTAAGSGRRAGVLAAFAMMVGALAWAAAALFGLQALFARYEWLYFTFRVAGSLYLLWLAWLLLRNAGAPLAALDAKTSRSGGLAGFLRALLLQLGNPKIMVFFGSIFLSLLPANPPAWMAGAVLAVVAFNEFVWFALLAIVFSGGTAKAFYGQAKIWMDRIMGGALGLLGLRLALSDR